MTVHWSGPPVEDDTRGPFQLEVLEHLGLRRDSRLLEIGCGMGRLAYELSTRLDDGTYTGFDVSPDAIGWLREHYATALPHFRFDLIDATNPRFRPGAGRPADEVRFPYDDRSFDLACCFAVFMHLTLPEVRHYLRELGRVLEPGGRAAVELMAITPEDSAPAFGTPYVELGDGVWTRLPDRVGEAMAYDDELFRAAAADAGLAVDDLIPGRWHPWAQPEPGKPRPGADLYVLSRPR